MNKEEKSAYMKVYQKTYRQTPQGKKSNRIARWKYNGIIVEDYNKFYDSYIKITDCELCNKALTIDKYNTHSTRCVDHDHAINDRPNVRAVCCHACNVNDNLTNTSGEPNIYYHKLKGKWAFFKKIQGKIYTKGGFKTFKDAVQYKYQFLSNFA